MLTITAVVCRYHFCEPDVKPDELKQQLYDTDTVTGSTVFFQFFYIYKENTIA